ATPRSHGIIGNEWYVKTRNREVYCAYDSSAKAIGNQNKAGMMSPRNLLSSTIGDEMKMTSNGNAKVFGVALKDRSSIFPAGHTPNGAFWFDDESGDFISSNYYGNDIPQWLKNFNAK